MKKNDYTPKQEIAVMVKLSKRLTDKANAADCNFDKEELRIESQYWLDKSEVMARRHDLEAYRYSLVIYGE